MTTSYSPQRSFQLINAGAAKVFMPTLKFSGTFLFSSYTYINQIPLKIQDSHNPGYPYDPNWVATISGILSSTRNSSI